MPDKFIEFIRKNKWNEAVTYRETAPHEYLVKDKLSEEDKKTFERFVVFIRENGYEQKFYSQTYIYYNVGEKKYWTMGDPIEKTEILNRDDKDKRYGGM
ncbi:hypothetical protein KO465_05180 [Candidatus Micrarchaeota archaeon]|nr:hypothetical protein [Candidatus Micrarchaeota archaeon]